MPNSGTLVYWDTDVCVSYIEQHPERWPEIDALAEAVSNSNGTLRLVTSAWTVAEVAYIAAEKERVAAPDAEERIKNFWNSRIIEIHELHRMIAEQTRDIVRAGFFNKWSIKPKDAVHLATAAYLGVAEFHTYDKEMIKKSADRFSFRVTEPNRLLIPFIPGGRARPKRSPQQRLMPRDADSGGSLDAD